ncbi:MAG TPA: adenylate/guanylate cyclase domain-containing protein [Gaiellaceae bacterium]|nr:adenylate/guanylate cyclase domain-containing protein [Gaiellaceae bacterium]HEU5405345.1 adenylate/guanylate cyclase domain-containing protein [Gaiellaceae bacterium]
MTTLPAGTVTFVFTDIEGSTRLLQELGDEAYGRVSGDHRRLVREMFGAHGGTEIDTQGDAFFFSFPRARDAVAGAVEAQRALRDHEWGDGRAVSVRMGLHTGEPHVGEEGYLGLDVVRAARISAAGHGGQILISETTRALLGNQLPDGVAVHDLGEQHLKDVQHEHIYELTIDGRAVSPKPLKTQSPKSRQEDMASRFEERITAYVEKQLESAFDEHGPTKLAFGGAAIGFGVLLMTVVVIVAIVLLVKVVFF